MRFKIGKCVKRFVESIMWHVQDGERRGSEGPLFRKDEIIIKQALISITIDQKEVNWIGS